MFFDLVTQSGTHTFSGLLTLYTVVSVYITQYESRKPYFIDLLTFIVDLRFINNFVITNSGQSKVQNGVFSQNVMLPRCLCELL